MPASAILKRSSRRILFALVVLTGSFLLFLVQPLVARLALPMLGGAPNVWNSAMLTFQSLLLAGYAYAHMLARLPLRRQAVVHLALLGLAALSLPIALPELRAADGWEVLTVPAMVALTVGPVFVLVAAQASLMQQWFAAAPEAGDPYSLYAASNLGSFAGLIAYPFWFEPRMDLAAQSDVWSAGYFALILLVFLAAAASWNVGASAERTPKRQSAPPAPLNRRTVLFWLALAAVPSGLMLSTTTLLTTDLMAMPLLWVIPLGLYLLSFSLAFSETGDWTAILTRVAPLLLLSSGSLAMISGGQANPAIALVMVSALFILAVALHGRLFALRPAPERLTFFYLIVAIGGALGGVFTAVIAPVLFDWIYEHAILLLAAGLLLPQHPYYARLTGYLANTKRGRQIVAALFLAAGIAAWQLAGATERGDGVTILALVSALVIVGAVFVGMRWAYAAMLLLIMLGHGGWATLQVSAEGSRSRTYFGVYSVVEPEGEGLRQLSHGTTVHGEQWLDPRRRLQPTSYYGGSAGIGIALEGLAEDARVGIVGLGAGTLACYRQPGQDWTFYEIDRRMLEYSRNRTFTFLAECAPDAEVIIGDARLELEAEPTRYDLLAVDAFSSDSIPLHLMTVEAFAAYGRALAPDGLLLVHISNRFIDFAPMIAAIARAEGWEGRIRRDMDDPGEGLSPSIWVALSREQARLAPLEQDGDTPWEDLPRPARCPWTDDNASIVSLIF